MTWVRCRPPLRHLTRRGEFSSYFGAIQSSGSDLGHAAIESKVDAGDETGIVGGEIKGGRRDFLGSAEATHQRDRGGFVTFAHFCRFAFHGETQTC
jgi:hypothetical protein